jgi:hypothetical protein
MIKPTRERYDEFLKDTEKIISVYHPKISDVDIKSMAMDITMLLARYEEKLWNDLIERFGGMTKKYGSTTRE